LITGCLPAELYYVPTKEEEKHDEKARKKSNKFARKSAQIRSVREAEAYLTVFIRILA